MQLEKAGRVIDVRFYLSLLTVLALSIFGFLIFPNVIAMSKTGLHVVILARITFGLCALLSIALIYIIRGKRLGWLSSRDALDDA